VTAALSGRRAVLLFAAANLLFLMFDVALAHSSFQRSRLELVPLAVSAIAGPAVALLALLPAGSGARTGLWPLALSCLATGVWGLRLHLGNGAFSDFTLHRLVYSAPLAAPLAYAGLGLLILVAEHADAGARGRLIELLAGLGLLGNFVLCLLDHAQNGFWAPAEWLSVAAGAVGGLSLCAASSAREERESERRFLWTVVTAMAAVGAIGAALHLRGLFSMTPRPLLERLQYGPPVFAPMLFADLAALGALGLLARSNPTTRTAE
jgi:hypothetical protein